MVAIDIELTAALAGASNPAIKPTITKIARTWRNVREQTIRQLIRMTVKSQSEVSMMMGGMGGGMMWGMGLGGLLLIAFFVLCTAALIKYLFFR